MDMAGYTESMEQGLGKPTPYKNMSYVTVSYPVSKKFHPMLFISSRIYVITLLTFKPRWILGPLTEHNLSIISSSNVLLEDTELLLYVCGEELCGSSPSLKVILLRKPD